jgi:hypothetical protein
VGIAPGLLWILWSERDIRAADKARYSDGFVGLSLLNIVSILVVSVSSDPEKWSLTGCKRPIQPVCVKDPNQVAVDVTVIRIHD